MSHSKETRVYMTPGKNIYNMIKLSLLVIVTFIYINMYNFLQKISKTKLIGVNVKIAMIYDCKNAKNILQYLYTRPITSNTHNIL